MFACFVVYAGKITAQYSSIQNISLEFAFSGFFLSNISTPCRFFRQYITITFG